MRKANLLIIDGSGHLCELNHYPAILSIRNEGIDTRVVAICDPQDPRSTNPKHYKAGRKNLDAILLSYNPIWINPMSNKRPELKRY